jgi:hypothetical protein
MRRRSVKAAYTALLVVVALRRLRLFTRGEWDDPDFPDYEPYEEPRTLTAREREILDFLLTVDMPGMEELREQAKTALAERVGARDPGFALYVDKETTSPSPLRARPLIQAFTMRKDVDSLYELLLWLDDEGWLSYVEFTVFGDAEWLEELLPASDFDPPQPFRYDKQ